MSDMTYAPKARTIQRDAHIELDLMERMLINASQRDEKRVAIVTENVLFDFITERPGFEQKIGNIYLARITSIEPSLDAIFVEFGSERHGFLPLKEVSRQYFNPKAEQQHGRPGIRDLLRVGQELMIQVEKEERGNKGAALTTYISLAGSYLVLMPNSPRAGGISRRIEGDERDQLREILNQVSVPEGMGLIVRTAAIGRSNEELKWDLDVLLAHWKNIEEAAKTRHAPFLIHQEGNVVIRAIRDYVRQDTAEIIIDDETEYQNAKHYLEQIRPDVADRVKLYNDPTPLFSRYGIEHQIETAYKRAIDLPSGASIVIDYTEALVSIDINSARATKGSNIEATAFNTNIEAAEEIARQLRLRDIGGLIVIDFIDMLEANNQIEVEKHLAKCLKNDRARIQIQRISRFGLLEMSRQRLRPSLRDSHQHVCPTCSGHGTIRSVDSVALTLVRIIEEEALKPHTAEIVIQASTEAATYLLNEKRHLLAALEKNHDVKVSVVPNPNLQSSNYLKKRIRVSDTDETGLSSSERLQEPTVDINSSSSSERPAAHKPAVKQMIPTRPEKSSAGGGLIKRLISSMFGQQEEEEETGGTTTGRSESTYQPKPTYTPRAPAHRQRTRRPPRGEEDQEGTESRDSRDRSTDSRDSRDRSGSGRRSDSSRSGDRSEQRTGDSRQRSGGQRQQRSGGRNAPASKSGTPSRSTQYGDNYQDQYKEYSQNADQPTSGSAPRAPSVPEPAIKSTPVNKLADEAPITIKASTSPTRTGSATPSSSSSSATTPSSSTTQTPSSSTPTSSSSTQTSSSSAPTSSSATQTPSSNAPTSTSSTQSPNSTTGVSSRSISPSTTYAPRSGSAVPTQPAIKSYAPSSTPPTTARPVTTSTPVPSSTTSASQPSTLPTGSQAPASTPSTSQTPSSTPSSSQTTSSTSSTSQTQASSASSEEHQKPLIVRATTEEKLSTSTTTQPSTEKKDKESSDL